MKSAQALPTESRLRAAAPQPGAVPRLGAAIRQSDGRLNSQVDARPGADLVKLLPDSGCRLSEATALRWRDVDFKKNTLTSTGGQQGTKVIARQPRKLMTTHGMFIA